jgi:hypothetical protein
MSLRATPIRSAARSSCPARNRLTRRFRPYSASQRKALTLQSPLESGGLLLYRVPIAARISNPRLRISAKPSRSVGHDRTYSSHREPVNRADPATLSWAFSLDDERSRIRSHEEGNTLHRTSLSASEHDQNHIDSKHRGECGISYTLPHTLAIDR